MDNSQNPLYYHDAYWVAKVKPEGAPAKITVINDMHIDTSTNRVTVYAQSKVLGKIVSPPQVEPGACIETKNDTLCFHPKAVYLNGSGAELDSSDVSHGVAISSDSKYAFISVEGIGGEPGIVDVIELESQLLIDKVEIGKQAGGIAFWKKEI